MNFPSITKLDFEGPLLLQAKVFQDERGLFCERYHPQRHADLRNDYPSLPTHFCQSNFSRSSMNCLRGIHYQAQGDSHPAQGKMISIMHGKILDIVLDIRPNSPTFGQSLEVELCGQDQLQLWIPGGFAHAFCVQGEEHVDMLYEVDVPYLPQFEGGIYYADPSLNIKWPDFKAILSPRDQELPSWQEFLTRQNP